MNLNTASTFDPANGGMCIPQLKFIGFTAKGTVLKFDLARKRFRLPVNIYFVFYFHIPSVSVPASGLKVSKLNHPTFHAVSAIAPTCP